MDATGYDDLLMRAEVLARDGDDAAARELVMQALRLAPEDVRGWWALAQVARSDLERRQALRDVLRRDPDHGRAQHFLDLIEAGHIASLDEGASLADLVGRRAQPYPVFDFVEEPQRKAHPAPKEKHHPGAVQDYLPHAILTLVAYWFFWFAGLVLNIFFLYDARHRQRNSGIQPLNTGCLRALLYSNLAFAVLGVLLFVLIVGMTMHRRF